jgi:iron complex transport system permease protein
VERYRSVVAWSGLVLLFLLAAVLSVAVGPGGLTGAKLGAVMNLRLLRLALGITAGGVLAVVGASLQGLLQNPLADPFTMGVASGAALGAGLTVVLGQSAGVFAPVGGFAGALLTMLVVYALARVRGRVTATGLVLAGVIMSFLFSSLVMLVMILGRRTLGEAVYMMMGHLGTVFTGATVWLFGAVAVLAVAGCWWLFSLSRPLDIMSSGEETAETLGVDTQRVTRGVFVVSSLLVGLVVSFTGAISFVGLVVPHLVRMLFGPAHRRVLPAAFLAGAGILLLADVLARNVVPGGLPLSVVTALVGVPFFIYLLRSRL